MDEFVAVEGIDGRTQLLLLLLLTMSRGERVRRRLMRHQELASTRARSGSIAASNSQHEPHHREEGGAGLSRGGVEVSNLDENTAGAQRFGGNVVDKRWTVGRQEGGYKLEAGEGEQPQQGPVGFVAQAHVPSGVENLSPRVIHDDA